MPRRSDSQISKGTLKLVSLCLALILELYFYSQDNSVTRLVSAVVEFQNIPENRIIIDPPHATQGIPAHIEIYGPKSIVDQISSGFHVLKIPFPENSPFSFPVDINYETLRFPPSVTIANAKPARLTVRTVELVRKEVPVEVPFSGSPKEGVEIISKKFFPKTIILRGPMQELQKVNKILTDPVILSELESNTRFELKVSPPGEFTTLNVNLIGIDIEIKETSDSNEESVKTEKK